MGRTKHLFTDASCIHGRSISSWAALLIDGMQSHFKASLIDDYATSTIAEALAVRMALSEFNGAIGSGDAVIVHSDCAAMIAHLGGNVRKPPACARLAAEIEEIKAIAARREILIRGEWIRGHSTADTTDWRSLINRRVDLEARRLTRQENRRRLDLGDTGREKCA
jgi:ribonuclease HI